MQMKIYIRP